MVVGADKTGGCTALNDSRVTRAGKVMRRLKLDELPQLLNIIKGDMSFVGPRPELLLYTNAYTEEEQCILWVRPGITDRSSLVFISQDEIVGTENPVENYEKYVLPEKNRLRVEYAKNQSFGLDARLLLETIGGVFGKAKNMAEEGMGKGSGGESMEYRDGMTYTEVVHAGCLPGREAGRRSDLKVLAWLIRRHGLEMTHMSRGSHIGSVFSVAEIMAVLYTRILHVNPRNEPDGRTGTA